MDHADPIIKKKVCPFWCETDIISNPGSDVGRQFLEVTPKTTMEYVVQAFLKCIEESDMAGIFHDQLE